MTTKQDIFDIILNSSLDDWEECHVDATRIYDIKESPDASIKESKVIYYKNDVNIRFEFRDTLNDDFIADWANGFPDTKARSHEFVLYYAATPIKAFVLVGVDGYRAYLPVPSLENGKLKVSKIKAKVAEIYDNDNDHYNYMRMANFIVED